MHGEVRLAGTLNAGGSRIPAESAMSPALSWKQLGALNLVVVLCCGRVSSLSVGYYNDKCAKAERLIRDAVSSAYQENQFVASALLRLHFHDCMVQGCDGSVLIDSTATNSAEKDAALNTGLRFFSVIDDAKAAVEKECPGVVSCADILAFAARDSVKLTGGPVWDVEAGRKDGTSSSAEKADGTLPTQQDDVNTLIARFQKAMGLSLDEVVTLSGSHTIGQTFCTTIDGRLRPTVDPSLGGVLAQQLLESCPADDNFTTRVNLDVTSPVTFDHNYYRNLKANKGVLATDQLLYSDIVGRPLVEVDAADERFFFDKYKAAILHMGRAGTLSYKAGRIRANCRIVN